MTNQELEERCREVIAEATIQMEKAGNARMKRKWELIRETWVDLLKKAQGMSSD
jgi:hypothetical protein